jgi:multidrug efflux pump subunit AcrB
VLVAIRLVYLILVILVRLLRVPVGIFFALPLVVIGACTALAVTGRALNLSVLADLRMLRAIAVTNATVLRDLAVATNAIVLLALVQYKIEAGADVRTTLIQDEAHAGARVAHRYKHRCLQTCGDARADRG